MHKAIIFDLGKVLVPFDFMRGYQALEAHCPYPVAEIRSRIAATRLVEPLEKGLITPRDFVHQLSEALDLEIGYDEFCRIWSCIFSGQLIPDAVLESLARRYRLLLLSNTNEIHFEMIRENYTLIRHFHDLVLSYQVHAMKPEPEIFRAAVARAGCRPGECFYTDDIGLFVEAARCEGLDAVQFESPEQIEREMNARGITW
ncbi:MAG TPA: HAD family hydrolase [Bryobacteraceae bacterium]|nr:HAD family hydrolase [Bryobacteraceae bacterium]